MTRTDATKAIHLIKARRKVTGEDLASAARWFKREYPKMAASVMDQIGV